MHIAMLSPTVYLLQLRIKFLGNYTRSDLCRQNFQGGVSSDWLDRMTHFKRWRRKPKHFSVGAASSRRKSELLQIVKSVKQPDDWHGKGGGWEIPATLNMKLLLLRVFFCLNFDIWYSWYMTFSMILGFFLAPKRLRDNSKSQIQSHLNILNYCLTITCYGLIRCYGVTSGKCFRPLRWNFGAFADTHIFDSWWRGHFWERGRMQRERGQ